MSVVTLDAELKVESNATGSTEEAQTKVGRTPLSARRPQVDSILWGFDEPLEKARFDRIQKRLIRLEAALFEEFGSRIDGSSRDCLLRLFVACPSVRAPSISAQPDGILVATWRRDDGQELVVKCVSKEMVHFAFVTRSTERPSMLDRQWGTCHSPSLFLKETPVARSIAE